MGHSIQFALLQKEAIGPTADQLKRAFKAFSNLTDADAVRLAAGARSTHQGGAIQCRHGVASGVVMV